MTRRGWIVLASVVAIVLAIALTPFAFDYAVGRGPGTKSSGSRRTAPPAASNR